MNRLAPAKPVPGGETPELYDALRRGPSAEAVARVLGISRIARIRRDRVHFSGARPAQLSLIIDKGDGATFRIWAEWLGDRAHAHAEAERASLRKSRRNQIVDAGHGGVLADQSSGFVLRRVGLDSKLPGLRLLYDADAAAELIARVEGHGPAPGDLRISLVAHRLGKRAVVRIDGPGGYQRYARLRATSSGSGSRSFDSHMALWRTLGNTDDLRVPEPVGFDPEFGIAVFKPLSGRPPDFAGLPGFSACRFICRAMNALRALEVDAPPHCVGDEMDILKGWAVRLCGYAPELEPKVSQALDLLAKDMGKMEAIPAAPCHRDLHEKQILLSEQGAGLLDFDTLRLGDPALDIGNLQAHLYLAGQRGVRSRAAFEDALIYKMDVGFSRRVAIWRRAALLRLAMIYAFTDEPRGTINALIREASARRSG